MLEPDITKINLLIKNLEVINMNAATIKFSFAAITIALYFISSAFSAEPTGYSADTESKYNDFTKFSEDKYSTIEDNLLIGVRSENTGLKISSAYFLGEMKSGKSLIPLLKLARNGVTEEERIIAGLSLYKIESNIGMHLLKGLSQSDESRRVRNIFSKIYKIYLSNNRSFVSN